MIELEKKSLLGNEEKLLNRTLQKLATLKGENSIPAVLESYEKQENYYYKIDNKNDLKEFTLDNKTTIKLNQFNNPSIRIRVTKNSQGEVKKKSLIIKDDIDTNNSDNGNKRIEKEYPFKDLVQFIETDLEKIGIKLVSRWRRERITYSIKYGNIKYYICIDKNSGYGYIIEIETMVKDQDKLEAADYGINHLFLALDLKELETNQLNQMFNEYNSNWEKYFNSQELVPSAIVI